MTYHAFGADQRRLRAPRHRPLACPFVASWRTRPSLLAATILLLTACAPHPVTPGEWLQRSAAYHGALASADGLDLRLTGERVMVDQSRRADPPWDREPAHVRIVVDAGRGRWLWESSTSYPGLGAFAGRRVITRERQFEIDPLGNGHGTEAIALAPGDSLALARTLGRYLPPLLLRQALQQGATARLLDAHATPDRVRLQFTEATGDTIQLVLDRRSARLVAMVTVRHDVLAGHVIDSILYSGEQRVRGLRLPTTWREFQGAQLVRELTYRIEPGTPADSLFELPPGYTWPNGDAAHRMPADTSELVQHAPGVYVEAATGTLVVALHDSLVLFDCPNDAATSRTTFERLGVRLPGKPVRLLVASHTHPDHCGGAREHFRRGVPAIVAEGHVGFYRRLAAYRAVDGYDAVAAPLRLQPLAPGEGRTLSDGTRTIRLFNVGPSPHTEETIIALIEPAGLLWQVDHFLAPMTGPIVAARPVTNWLARELERLGLRFSHVIDTHTGTIFPRRFVDEALMAGGYAPLRPARHVRANR